MRLGKNGLRWGGVALGAIAAFGLAAACNTHPAEFSRSSGLAEVIVPESGSVAEQLDILWMVDNSGSMCQEQKVLRESFQDFLDVLADIDLDFHMALTTTHMKDDYPYEPLARPGHFQSTPQPLPGFDPSCFYEVNPDGTLNHDSMQPVLDAIANAVSCTKDPSEYQHLLNPDIQSLRCSIHPAQWSCSTEQMQPRENFFPDPADYREIPKVLKRADYQNNDGTIDFDRLKADFACMSMVGTLGYGIEKGLSAVVRALDPELTEEGGPNAGFLRPDARTGIILVSDENDCSHEGSVNEMTSCGVAECTFSESELTPVEQLKAELMANLAASKGVAQVSDDDVIVASIHGRYQIYDQPRPEPTCEQGFEIPYSCASTLGIAYSGHRYDAFVRQFPTFFPPADSNRPDDPLRGAICGHFGGALAEIAELFRVPRGGCIADIYRCEGADDTTCPAFPHTGEPGTCRAYPNHPDTFYCDSGIQVRIKYNAASPADAQARLQANPYCLEESIGLPEFKYGCVVDPQHYRFIGCPGGGTGLQLVWNDEQSQFILSGAEIQIRYAMVPEDED